MLKYALAANPPYAYWFDIDYTGTCISPLACMRVVGSGGSRGRGNDPLPVWHDIFIGTTEM